MRILWGLLFASGLAAQMAPNCSITTSLSQTGDFRQYDNRIIQCTAWQLTYTATGYSALSIVLESAPDQSGNPGTWTTQITLTDPNQSSGGWTGLGAWIRVRVAAETGNGGIRAIASGYLTNPNASTTVAVSVTPQQYGCAGLGEDDTNC